MSEKWGICRSCLGSGCECFHCGGTGFNGGYLDALPSPKQRASRVHSSLILEKVVNLFERAHIHMSNQVTVRNQSTSLAERFQFTSDQLDLIKRTVAKNATDDELDLFFTRCKMLGLNPLMPGQVYFLKFKKRNPPPGTTEADEAYWNPGTTIVGIDGFRSRADRTGKLSGIKRGVIRNAQGVCIGGWADVFRKDWDYPAHTEVSLKEYADPYKETWKNMPESMIQKVAEVAALRMAFPDDLGGMYSHEEMDQAQKDPNNTKKVVKDFEQPKATQEPQILPPVGSSNANVETSNVGSRKPSDAQIKRLFAIAYSSKVTNEQLKYFLDQRWGKQSSKDLTLSEYDQTIDAIQAGELNHTADVVVQPQSSSELPPIEESPFESEEPTNTQVPWAKYRTEDVRIVK